MPSPRTTVSAGRNRDPQATSHQLRALTRSPVWTYALTWGLGHRGAPPPSRKRAAGVAFDLLDGLGTPNDGIFGARCPAHAHLYRRFACLLAKADARLKARMVRQSFPSPDFHRLSTTKLGWRSQDLPLLLPEVLENWLNNALTLGFKFMRAPRFGAPHPNFLASEHYFVEYSDKQQKTRQERFSELVRRINNAGSGQAVIKSVGTRINHRLGVNGPWFQSLDQPKDKVEKKEVIDAVAEWADGDTVAAHYAYSNDFLCTEDTGKSSVALIFNSSNRQWLQEDYGLSFVSISQLAAKL